MTKLVDNSLNGILEREREKIDLVGNVIQVLPSTSWALLPLSDWAMRLGRRVKRSAYSRTD